MDKELTIIIPAAGLGRRMKSYGPKSIIYLNQNQTLIGRQLSILKDIFPSADIIVVLGFEAEKVYKMLPRNVRVVENEHYDSTNVARSLFLGINASKHSNTLIVYGDLVFNEQTFRGLPLDSGSFVIIDNKNQIREYEVGLTVVDGHATQFSYGLPTKWAQIAYLSGKDLDNFYNSAADIDHKKYYGFEILNNVIERGSKLSVIEPEGMKIYEIDSSKDIEEAKKII
jgi:choline kinase